MMKKAMLLLLILLGIGINLPAQNVLGLNGTSNPNNSQDKEEINCDSGGDWGWGHGARICAFSLNNEDETPTLYLCGTNILIDSSVMLTNVEVVITNSLNNVIYDSYIVVYGDEEYCYPLDGIVNGTYKIEVKQGGNYLVGYFEIK